MRFATRKESQEQARKEMRRTRRKHGYRLVDESNPSGEWEVYAIEVDYDVKYLMEEIQFLKEQITEIKKQISK